MSERDERRERAFLRALDVLTLIAGLLVAGAAIAAAWLILGGAR